MQCNDKTSLGALLLIPLVLLLSASVAAHPGGLNSEGCHNDRKQGDYHCHSAPANRMVVPPHLWQGDKTAPSCEAKRYCKEMLSCAEAVHYLYSCGLKRLDSDRDGIPCETLCGNGQAGAERVEQLLRKQK